MQPWVFIVILPSDELPGSADAPNQQVTAGTLARAAGSANDQLGNPDIEWSEEGEGVVVDP